MSELVSDCPRCGSKKITFTLSEANEIRGHGAEWQKTYEVFSTCRHCQKSTIFVLLASEYGARTLFASAESLIGVKGAVNSFMRILGFVSTKDVSTEHAPEHLPQDIAAIFNEATTCKAVNCNNAAATMFRLCLDLATREKLPADKAVPNHRTRRDLGLRLPWLFDNGLLPEDLRDLSHAVKEDGNDGAHAGNITSADVEDLLDFSRALLERLYTQPRRLQIAKERRDERRQPS